MVQIYCIAVETEEDLENIPSDTKRIEYSGGQLTRIFKLNTLNLTSLTTLFFSGKEFTKIENLDNLPSLVSLSFTHTSIVKIENLNLPSLKYLTFGRNPISKIENLDNLPSLTTLQFSYTLITKLENLNLPSLEYLIIESSPISKIENLDNLTSLRSLRFSDIPITKLENLEMLTDLKNINISFAQITILEGLETLENLECITVYNNHPNFEITYLEELPSRASLHFMEGDKIGWITPIIEIQPEEFIRRKKIFQEFGNFIKAISVLNAFSWWYKNQYLGNPKHPYFIRKTKEMLSQINKKINESEKNSNTTTDTDISNILRY